MDGRAGPRVNIRGHELLSFSSYDYLGLANHPAIDRAAIAAVERYGVGTGGVRLLSGTTEIHCEVERAIARFKGVGADMLILVSQIFTNDGQGIGIFHGR